MSFELMLLTGDGTGCTLEDGDAVILGREEGCDLRIDSPQLSRKHCRVWVQGAALWVEDMGSINGTLIDGERISCPTRLTHQQVIQIGLTRIAVIDRRGAPAPAPAPQPRPAPEPVRVSTTSGLTLVALNGPRAGEVIGVPSDEATVGRDEGCTIQLDDASVSSSHATLRPDGDAIALRDTSSTGTFVNGSRVEQARIKPGDHVTFGPRDFRVELAAVVPPPPRKEPKPSPRPRDSGRRPRDSMRRRGSSGRSKNPPDPARRRKQLLAFGFVAFVFISIDVIIVSYERGARKAYERGNELSRIGHYEEAREKFLSVPRTHPFSYVACRARRRLVIDRRGAAPDEPMPRTTSPVPLIAGFLAVAFAVVLFRRHGRKDNLLDWPPQLFLACLMFFALQVVRQLAPTAAGVRLSKLGYFEEIEFLAGIGFMLATFCLIFWLKKREPEDEGE